MIRLRGSISIQYEGVESRLSFYREHIYPHLVSAFGNPNPIAEIRKRMIPLAAGDVLEIGEGPGVNFPHYDPDKVKRIYALDPNPGMLSRADASSYC
jgi:hypothetical protein